MNHRRAVTLTLAGVVVVVALARPARRRLHRWRALRSCRAAATHLSDLADEITSRITPEDADARLADIYRRVAADGVPVPSFTCPACGNTSYHPKDVEQGYCGNCHDFTADPVPTP